MSARDAAKKRSATASELIDGGKVRLASWCRIKPEIVQLPYNKSEIAFHISLNLLSFFVYLPPDGFGGFGPPLRHLACVAGT
jgi:hypothetical protein